MRMFEWKLLDVDPNDQEEDGANIDLDSQRKGKCGLSEEGQVCRHQNLHTAGESNRFYEQLQSCFSVVDHHAFFSSLQTFSST